MTAHVLAYVIVCMYACMYVCMYVCMHACMCEHVFVSESALGNICNPSTVQIVCPKHATHSDHRRSAFLYTLLQHSLSHSVALFRRTSSSSFGCKGESSPPHAVPHPMFRGLSGEGNTQFGDDPTCRETGRRKTPTALSCLFACLLAGGMRVVNPLARRPTPQGALQCNGMAPSRGGDNAVPLFAPG